MSVVTPHRMAFSDLTPKSGKPSSRGEALNSLAGSKGLRDRFYAWRGKSGRRYVCSVFGCGEEGFIADVTSGAIVGVVRDDAVTRPVCVIPAGQSGAIQTLRALGRELGVAEWHVHFSGEMDAVVSDLHGSLFH